MAFEKAEKDREMMGEQEEAVVTEISDEQRLKMTEMRMLRSATILERDDVQNFLCPAYLACFRLHCHRL